MNRKDKELFAAFNEIFGLIRVNPDTEKLPQDVIFENKAFNQPIQGWFFIPKTQLSELCEKFLSSTKEMKGNFSYKVVYSTIFDELCAMKLKSESFTEDLYRDVIAIFNEIKPREIEVVVPIYGLEVKTEKPITIEGFTIYGELHYSELKAKYGVNREGYDNVIVESFLDGGNFISCKVMACDCTKAYEIASELFERLENIMKLFCHFYGKNKDIGIFYYNSLQRKKYIGLSLEKQPGYKFSLEGAATLIDIEESFLMKNPLFSKMVQNLCSRSSSEMETRVMRAIDFCGRASYEKQTDLAFLFCMFGLEALLQSQDNNFVSASITSQMIDAYALIISKDYEDRIKCSNDFQNLYKKRCELAHGGGRNIAEDDYTLALNYLHNLIARFLNDEKLSRIATMKQFKEYVRDLKFQKS